MKLLWALFIVLTILIFSFSMNKGFDRDELESMHVAWKILQGERIYVDFFENHHPFFYYLLTPIVAAFNNSINALIVARIMIFCMFLGILVVAYKLSCNLFNKQSAGIGLILLCMTKLFVLKAIEIRPDVPYTLFSLLSIFFLFNFFQEKLLNQLISSAICLAIAFLFLQKVIILVPIILGLLLFSDFKNKLFFKDTAVYLSVFIICILPYFLYVLCAGEWSAYWVSNWATNFHHLEPYHNKLSAMKPFFHYIIKSFKENPLIWILIVCSFKLFHHPRLGILTLSLFILYFLGIPLSQYLMLVMVLVAIIAGDTFNSFLRSKVSSIFIVLLIFLPGVLFFYFKDLRKYSGFLQFKKIEYVLAITSSNDYVLDRFCRFNFCRKDLDFFWRFTMKTTEKEFNKTIIPTDVLINQLKPKVIVRTGLASKLKTKKIPNHYRISELYPDLLIRRD